MHRFLAVILALLFSSHPLINFLGVSSVAAQDIQPAQNSGAGAAQTEKILASPPQTPTPTPIPLQIPDGTLIDIEAPYTLNSMDFKPNDKISFHVVNPIKVNGVTVIEQGCNCHRSDRQGKKRGHFGKAGLFVWTMQTATAVDGSQVPLRVAPVRLRGDSKGAKVATQMIITGALMPFIAPIALLHGFKRGKDAFIPAGKRYSVYVEGNHSVVSAPE